MAPTVDIWLENMAGDVQIPIFLDYGRDPAGLIAVDQLAGVGITPTTIATYPTPGIPGVNLGDVSYPPRDVTLALLVAGTDEAEYREKIALLRRLTDPSRGGFWLNAATGIEIRRLHLMLRTGLENNPELDNAAVFVLDCVAAQPFVESYGQAEVSFTPFGSLIPFIVGD